MPRVDFIDISHHNGAIDWQKVASSGIVGVILKATEGTTYVDPKYEDNRKGAEAAGLKVATYHFLKHGKATDQMNHYLDTVLPVAGERMVIDYEDAACTYADLREATMWLRTNDPPLEVTIYGAAKLRDDVNKQDDVSAMYGTSLWAARYSSYQPDIGKAWPYWTAWQFTDSGTMPGISGHVDLNTFNGSVEACEKWFGPADSEIVPPRPEPAQVLVALTVPEGVEVIVSVNGIIAGS